MATSTACLLERLLSNGKFWLKRARVDAAHLAPDTPAFGSDRVVLADLRIECGRIRAVLPAGESPCCAPGLCLDGGRVQPLSGAGRIGPGEPAELSLVMEDGTRLDIQGGQMVPVTDCRYTG